MLDHAEVIRCLHRGARTTLGELAEEKSFGVAIAVLAGQCRALIADDPAFAAAVREVVSERLAALVSDPEIREKAASDPGDPNHAYWLLVTTDSAIRRLGQARAAGNPMEGLMSALASGRATIGGPFPFDPDAGGT